MAAIAGLRPLDSALRRVAAPAPVPPAALLLLAMALGGLGLTVLGRPPTAPAGSPSASVEETGAADFHATGEVVPVGDLPIIGDPIRDLTIWWSNRLTDANGAGLASLSGRSLTPVDPMADDVVRLFYGKILLITIPLLTLGGIVLSYLIMVSRTSGESAYSVRAVTPRFVVGATLSVLGIFLVAVFAQFVIATDLAMVGVALPPNAVGSPDQWPAAGGVFEVLQKASYDPRVPQGPGNWNTGAWLSGGLTAAVLVIFLQGINAALWAFEQLLVVVGPICLAAYALPATQRITNAWLKVLLAILLVRFAWTIVFVLFSLEALGHLGPDGNPPVLADTNALLGLAIGCALLMLVLPFGLIPLALAGPGPLRTET